jgi:hypothetical protein
MVGAGVMKRKARVTQLQGAVHPAPSTNWPKRLCWRVLMTSNGSVSVAATEPARAPDAKATDMGGDATSKSTPERGGGRREMAPQDLPVRQRGGQSNNPPLLPLLPTKCVP